MKGTVFQKEVEVKLETDGEKWVPGESIRGRFWIKNHSTAPFDLSLLQVMLGYANEKDVKAKAPDAFDPWVNPAVATGLLAPGQQSVEFPFDFPLSLKAPVTDTRASLYLVYGKKEEVQSRGLLRVQVGLHPQIEDYLNAIEVTHRFVRKSVSAGKKGWAEVKLDAPDGKDFTMVDGLKLSFLLGEGVLKVSAEFVVKSVNALSAGLQTTKDKKTFDQEWNHAELLHSFNQRVNKEKVETAFALILSELRGGAILRQ